MSIIDIRHDIKNVEKIVYADDKSFMCPGIAIQREDKYLELVDVDGDVDGRVCFEDIDNLILALQKAKELWA